MLYKYQLPSNSNVINFRRSKARKKQILSTICTYTSMCACVCVCGIDAKPFQLHTIKLCRKGQFLICLSWLLLVCERIYSSSRITHPKALNIISISFTHAHTCVKHARNDDTMATLIVRVTHTLPRNTHITRYYTILEKE